MAKNGFSPLAAGVAGAALGAVTGMLLSDQKTRSRIGKTVRDASEGTIFHEIGRKAKKMGEETQEKVEKEKDKVKRRLK